MKIRPAERRDLKRIEETMVANTLFTEEEVRCAIELVEIFLDEDDPERNDYLTHVVEDSQGRVQGFVCFGPTPLTDRVYDLYWIAVEPATQKKGFGQVLLRFVEDELRRLRGRMLLIETSSKTSYASTTRFYERSGYTEVSRIKDFYRADDDKIVYCKRLMP